jgi:hypothetical protein
MSPEAYWARMIMPSELTIGTPNAPRSAAVRSSGMR